MGFGKVKRVYFVIALALLQFGCPPGPAKSATFPLASDKTDIVGNAIVDQNAKIAIDVFIDATTSMMGFSNVAGVSSTVMDMFLEDLESTVYTSWKSSDLKYYKFGTKVREVSRSEFLQAKNPIFYTEKGIQEKTNIDSVIERTDPKRVNIVITDLFQSDNDAFSIVQKIKERCFKRGVQVGIIAIPADYQGKVFDSKVPPFAYKSNPSQPDTYRPFYMLVFGDEANISHLFETFKSRPYVQRGGMMIISRFVASDFVIKMNKVKGEKSISSLQIRNPIIPYRYSTSLNKKDHDIMLALGAVYTPRPWAPEVNTQKIQLEVYRQNASGKKTLDTKSALSSDIKLVQATGQPGNFDGVLSLNVSNPVNSQSYQVRLGVPSFEGFILPDWVKKFSSDNPRPGFEANKTIGLDRFVMDLLKTNATTNDIYIGKFILDVRNTK